MQKSEIITGTITKPTAVTVGSLCKAYTKLLVETIQKFSNLLKVVK